MSEEALSENYAWHEYLNATKDQHGRHYAEVEPWAWERLEQRLKEMEAGESGG